MLVVLTVCIARAGSLQQAWRHVFNGILRTELTTCFTSLGKYLVSAVFDLYLRALSSSPFQKVYHSRPISFRLKEGSKVEKQRSLC